MAYFGIPDPQEDAPITTKPPIGDNVEIEDEEAANAASVLNDLELFC